LTTSKAQLRTAALARRDAMPVLERTLGSATVAQTGVALVEQIARERGVPVAALTISAYWPMRSELDTRPLLAALADVECTVALPVVAGRDQPLVFRAWRPGEALVTARFGQSEPGPEAPVVAPSVLFVPLAAIDAEGNRIGYGGGFYDRTLAKLRATGPAAAIGLCFEAQLVDSLVAEPHDQPLDYVLTPARTLVTGRPTPQGIAL
jgi:5-formyltetrahydrofolate cyclo-ligase